MDRIGRSVTKEHLMRFLSHQAGRVVVIRVIVPFVLIAVLLAGFRATQAAKSAPRVQPGPRAATVHSPSSGKIVQRGKIVHRSNIVHPGDIVHRLFGGGSGSNARVVAPCNAFGAADGHRR
jgi:hypothetical protein